MNDADRTVIGSVVQTSNSAGTGNFWGFHVHYQDEAYSVDWSLVRVYVNPEPTWV